MICAGIDAGSRTIKIMLLDAATRQPLADGCVDQGIEQERLAHDLLDRLLEVLGRTRADLGAVVATGYGRDLIRLATRRVTEITCHARGVARLVPGVRTIIEIGGQDSKLIRLDPRGAVCDFAMNDRCAAGTGRFLELIAARLGDGPAGLGRLAATATRAASISSMCAVFAETEIIGCSPAAPPPPRSPRGCRRPSRRGSRRWPAAAPSHPSRSPAASRLSRGWRRRSPNVSALPSRSPPRRNSPVRSVPRCSPPTRPQGTASPSAFAFKQLTVRERL